MPEPVALSAAERIDKLLAGHAGQKFRVLAVVQAADADEPRVAEAIVADVDAAYPNTKSVFEHRPAPSPSHGGRADEAEAPRRRAHVER